MVSSGLLLVLYFELQAGTASTPAIGIHSPGKRYPGGHRLRGCTSTQGTCKINTKAFDILKFSKPCEDVHFI